MTLITPNGDEPQSDEMLTAAIEEFEQTIRDLNEMVDRIRHGEMPAESEAGKRLVQLRNITRLAMNERDRLEERRRKESGCVNGYAIDFGAARAEVGRRLARLRAAESTGDVPQGSG